MRAWTLAVALWASSAGAVGPFERNHPRAEEGLKAADEGRFEDALRAFGELKRELPDNLAVDYDRAHVLARMGRLEEARELFARLARTAPPELRQRAAYNLGNVHAQLSERKEAISAYRRALALDPADADARHNLELLLREREPPRPPEPDAGPPDAGGSDGGTEGGAPDAGPPDGGQGDGGARDGGPQQSGDGGTQDAGSDGGQGRGDREDAGQGRGEEQRPDASEGEDVHDGGQQAAPQEVRDIQPGDAGVPPGELSPEEAARLLDALKQNERNLQLWRFQRRKDTKDVEKDW